MSDNDERSFEEKMHSNWKNRTGEDYSPQRMIECWPLYGAQRRAAALDEIDWQIANTEISNSPSAIRAGAERLALRRELRALHAKMRAVGK